MDDHLPGVTAEAVAEELRREYVANLDAVPAQLSAQILQEVASSSAAMR
jgi:hypothetical protein